MGSYTGLRVLARLNKLGEDCLRLYKEFHNQTQIDYNINHWEYICENLDRDNYRSEVFKKIRTYSRSDRASFIPNGALCYMPDEWGGQENFIKHDIWFFKCSLKNYSDTIGRFLENILPLIVDNIYWCEALDESAPGRGSNFRYRPDRDGLIYKLGNGSLVYCSEDEAKKMYQEFKTLKDSCFNEEFFKKLDIENFTNDFIKLCDKYGFDFEITTIGSEIDIHLNKDDS